MTDPVKPTRLPPQATDAGQRMQQYPPPETWDDWTEYDPKAWPRKVARRYTLVPTVCFNCESACGLLAYVDKETVEIQKFEGNPRTPAAGGGTARKARRRTTRSTIPTASCIPSSAPGTRRGPVAAGDLGRGAGRHRRAHPPRLPGGAAHNEVMYHVGRPGHDGFMEWVLPAWGSTATTGTPTSARRGRGPGRPSGWGWTGPRPTTPTPA